MDIPSPFLVQIFLSSLLCNSITSLSVLSHLLSFQRYRSTCEIFEKQISWPLLHLKSPITLQSSSLPLFSPFLVFSYFSFLPPSSAPSLLIYFSFHFISLPPFVFATLNFPALVSTAYHTLLNTLLSSPLLFFSQSQDCGKQATVFLKLHSTSGL